jgi:hypothetical protein
MNLHVRIFSLAAVAAFLLACSGANDPSSDPNAPESDQSALTSRCPSGYTYYRAYPTKILCTENGPSLGSNGCHSDPDWACQYAFSVYNLCYVPRCDGH